MTSIALQHRDKIIESIAAGKILREIAAEFDITKQAISLALVNDPDYQAAIATRWQSKLDDGLQAIEDAVGDLDAVRAREAVLRRVEWRAEREVPHRWASRQQVTHEHVLRVEQRLERDLSALLGRVIEHETVAQGQHETVRALCQVQENNDSPSTLPALDALAEDDEHEQP